MRFSKCRRAPVPEPDAWIICAECGAYLPVTMVGHPALGTIEGGQYVAITQLDSTDVEAHMLTHA